MQVWRGNVCNKLTDKCVTDEGDFDRLCNKSIQYVYLPAFRSEKTSTYRHFSGMALAMRLQKEDKSLFYWLSPLGSYAWLCIVGKYTLPNSTTAFLRPRPSNPLLQFLSCPCPTSLTTPRYMPAVCDGDAILQQVQSDELRE